MMMMMMMAQNSGRKQREGRGEGGGGCPAVEVHCAVTLSEGDDSEHGSAP